MADLRAKALGYLRDANVTVRHARQRRLDPAPCEILATVQGHRARYVVELLDGAAWNCTCQGFTLGTTRPCAHIAAVQLITGHQSAAAKAVKAA